MKQSSLFVLKKVFVGSVVWLIVLVIFFCFCGYLVDARTRATRGPTCQWDDVPNPDGLPYSARWCKLTKDTVLLRLYDVKKQHLLAERTYLQLGQPYVSWARDRLWYDTYPDDAFIALPPSIFERLRAKLP